MPYEDYKKLVEVMSNELGPYKLVSFETDVKCTSLLPKIIDTRTRLEQYYGFIEMVEWGVYVDIFVLSGLGNTEDEAKTTKELVGRLMTDWSIADTKLFVPNVNPLRSVFRSCKHIRQKMKGPRYYINQVNQKSKKLPFDDYEYVTRFGLPFYKNTNPIYKKSYFENPLEADFCNQKFSIPSGYHEILTQSYGDYMVLPPIEKRVSEHRTKIYIK